MDIYKKIQKTRDNCIAQEKRTAVQSVESSAELFRLSNHKGIYKEVGRSEALCVLKNVLHKDMAYSTTVMSSEKAQNIANEFVEQFGDDAVFYTNGQFGKALSDPSIGPSWTPATDATFDTGVIVIAGGVVGCVWFMDED